LSYLPQTAQNPNTPPRSLHLALFITGGLWLLASLTISARAAQGITDRLNLPATEPLLEQAFLLFLLLLGFTLFDGLSRRAWDMRRANALPERATAPQEVFRGIAFGWAMLLAAVLPMLLTGALHLQFWLEPRAWGLTLISLASLALATLATEVAFRGYLYAQLTAAFGQTAATILLSALYALLSSFHPNATGWSILGTFLLAMVLCVAYQRTHAIWLGWGLHFGWSAATAILFGLPLAGFTTYSQIVTTTTSGPMLLTGDNYGPEGAAFTLVILLAAIPLLYRITRDYAWEYTHAPIVPAAYAVVIAPPAAHTAMEAAAAAAPAPLVQILGSTPTAASTMPVIDEHLRRETELPPSS
jgi:membrane protease YdiL (CAAX protease family)